MKYEARPNETKNRPKELLALVYNNDKEKIVAYCPTQAEAVAWAARLNGES